MSAAKVSIGLPAYNGEGVLPAALDSLLAQTFTDFEIVISDNASTDATEAICREYAARDPRIRYHRQERNLGAVPNFNRVFELSSAPLFKWHACDDICDPTFLERCVALLEERPDAAWVHSRSSHIDGEGRLLDDPDALDVSYTDRDDPSPSRRFGAVLLSRQGCLDSYGVFRREALARTPLYQPLYGAEKLFIAELSLLGCYAEVPETLFYARVVPQGSGNLKTNAEQQAFIAGEGVRGPRLVRLRYLQIYLAAIRRSAPDVAEAWRCRMAVMRWLFQVSKWRMVVSKALTGAGVGGGNRDRVKRLQERASTTKPRPSPSAAIPEPAGGQRRS